jgi:hypothetical protein
MDFYERQLKQWDLEETARKANAHLGVLQNPAENAMTHCVCAANQIDQAIKQGVVPDDVGREMIRELRSIDAAIGLYR